MVRYYVRVVVGFGRAGEELVEILIEERETCSVSSVRKGLSGGK